ncbi:hypothetical protein [Kaistia terrae]|uniref:Uncharacterized protein n=1 Tax=Kaistia terrae TaxID=537017 RepID=A0ABW0PVL1_9HYPH|nr:hypothetical protein [Kaistia terrae]MCX5576755.1 hypothetical protein [Kaistia terrae]
MRAEDILPDDVDTGEFASTVIRKGTVAAFLANAATFSDPGAASAARAIAEHHILEAVPALRALGLFDVMEVRDPNLRHWIADWTGVGRSEG